MNIALIQYGRALYGEHWQTPLARELNVAPRTVRRWSAGTFQVPEHVWEVLRDLMAEKAEALADLAAEV